MEYDEISLKVQIKGEIYAIPCNLAITPDGDKLIVVFKQERAGSVRELRDKLIADGKRFE